MRSIVLVAAVVACGAPAHPPVGTSPPVEPARPRRVVPTVVPAELGDAGVLARIPHRTRVLRFGEARLELDDEPETGSRQVIGPSIVLPVIGEKRDQLRVVTEDGDRSARIAVWIRQRDTWTALAAAQQLLDARGRPVAVWATLGAPVHPGERAGTLRAVRIPDDGVDVHGHAPSAMLTQVWLAAPGDKVGRIDGTEQGASHFARPGDVLVAPSTTVHAGRDASTPVLAIVTGEDVTAKLLADHGAVREIELARGFAKVRGFVATSSTRPVPEHFGIGGTGGGYGFGMSHADKLELPAGTCLYAAREGAVIGVQLKSGIRLGRSRTRDAAWALAYVNTAWGTFGTFVHDVGGDPANPRWESCSASGR